MRLLLIRFTALGDVALIAPAVRSLLAVVPDLEVTLLTRKGSGGLFRGVERLTVIEADLANYRGLRGLRRLQREVASTVSESVLSSTAPRITSSAPPEPFVALADLHGTLRARVISFFFRLDGLRRQARIDKGRRERRAQIRPGRRRRLEPLPHIVERYLAVFRRLGLDVTLNDLPPGPWIAPEPAERLELSERLSRFEKLVGPPKRRHQTGALVQLKRRYRIGVAPFAGRWPKVWPLDSMRHYVELLAARGDMVIYLFGGGEKEQMELRRLAIDLDGVVCYSDHFDRHLEQAMIEQLDLMVTMDSFNLHLAALIGRPTLSLWGATHPYAGFGPFAQSIEESVLQVDPASLDCRPCSIFGNRGCRRNDHACMRRIPPEELYSATLKRLAIDNGV